MRLLRMAVLGYNAALVPHMSHRIEVTGELSEVDGFPTITTRAVRHISAY